MKKLSQKGFAHTGLILFLLVLVLIAIIGYKVATNKSSSENSNSPTATTQQIKTINSKADLNDVEATLNSQNVDGDLNPDQLNQDVSSLL